MSILGIITSHELIYVLTIAEIKTIPGNVNAQPSFFHDG
jgi:hypothetical protein